MSVENLNILLADDDVDDCFFFKEALLGSAIPTQIKTVPDGEYLMNLLLDKTYQLPDVLFLDLNMPRKNGFECLTEIKLISKLKLLPIIMFSTSFEKEVVNQLYQNGAQYFMRKPPEFSQFKKIILQTLLIVAKKSAIQPERENFVITLKND